MSVPPRTFGGVREHVFAAVAWAPWADWDRLRPDGAGRDEEIDWLTRRDQLAAGWLLDRSRRDGTGLVLRVPSHAHRHSERTAPSQRLRPRPLS